VVSLTKALPISTSYMLPVGEAVNVTMGIEACVRRGNQRRSIETGSSETLTQKTLVA
jgi:hypothetical protein